MKTVFILHSSCTKRPAYDFSIIVALAIEWGVERLFFPSLEKGCPFTGPSLLILLMLEMLVNAGTKKA